MWWSLVLIGVLVVSSQSVRAGDPASLQDLLGRAQNQTERRAVEDLVEKLQGGTRKPPPAAAPSSAPAVAPPSAAPAPTAAEPASPSPPASIAGAPPKQPPPAAAPPPASAPAPPPSAPPEKAAASQPVTPQPAVESAAKKERPSVDLEVFFAYDEARITPRAASTLATLGRALTDTRLAGDAFLIAGHTDAKGGDDYNLALSERRAQSVRRFLIEHFKIAPDKLVAKGYGRRQLKKPNAPLAAENRRVQIVNLSK
jgi:outer membrane protein OmpA-like peptidoglycan-associated protein